MGASARGNSKMISEINVTPLVDIVLVLLVVFMVTAKVIVSQAMPLDLPKAAKSDAVQMVFGVELRVDGSITVDGNKVSGLAAILPLAKASKSKHQDLRAVIRAERDVKHGDVIEAMDLLKQAGISRIAFAVVPKAKQRKDRG